MIAVIIVNYGTPELVLSAIESLFHHEAGQAIEVHVVENASPDDSETILSCAFETRGWLDRVTLWVEKKNHGFGGGNNVVLEALAARPSPPDLVFLLNPDAALVNDAVSRLARALDREPTAAAAGAAILDAEGGEVTGAFRFPDLLTEVLRTANFGPLDRALAGRRRVLPPLSATKAVDWVSGAAVMFRFQAIREIGFFDPAYFLYYEEVDLMRRLSEAGHVTLHVPEARVVHIEGAATAQKGIQANMHRQPAYVYQSWRRYFVAAKGRLRALATAGLMVLAAAFNYLHSVARGKRPKVPQMFFRDQLRYVVLPLLQRDPRA